MYILMYNKNLSSLGLVYVRHFKFYVMVMHGDCKDTPRTVPMMGLSLRARAVPKERHVKSHSSTIVDTCNNSVPTSHEMDISS